MLVLCGAVVSGRLGVGLYAPEAVVSGKIGLCAPGAVVSGRLGAGLCAPGAVVSGRLGAGLCAPGAAVWGWNNPAVGLTPTSPFIALSVQHHAVLSDPLLDCKFPSCSWVTRAGGR